MPTEKVRHRGRRGQAMVETALVLLVLLVLGSCSPNRPLGSDAPFRHDKHQGVRCDPAGTATGAGILGVQPSVVEVALSGTPNTASHRIRVRVSKQLTLFSPYLPRTITPNSAIAGSPVESLEAAAEYCSGFATHRLL